MRTSPGRWATMIRAGVRVRPKRAFAPPRRASRDAAAAAQQVRAVLDEITDPASDLTASAATRHRLEGAALALEQVSCQAPRP
jgi:hypothetical protein